MDDCLKYNTLNSSRRHLKQWQVIHTNHNLLLTFPLAFNLKAQSHKGDKWKATPMQQNAQSHLHDLQPQQLHIYSLRSLLRLFWAVWLGFWQVSWSHIPSSQSAATAETGAETPQPSLCWARGQWAWLFLVQKLHHWNINTQEKKISSSKDSVKQGPCSRPTKK